ncbi:Co2+/Mg2+ efflux protein ApaG [Marinoscillum sp. MHG1-6]|uniref:Co2+/Mg2+ efflux protein ApaG n=1 Tax=Marinoscillum sp. MHG1-6 TaxID=2959627 RepID=UPI002157977F|nr:Co2+/Mg2+ efflux protein ApaG [Marinoscillum sp. MHG1-6]
MVVTTTKGIRVSVETEYQEEYSSPGQMHYVFTYKITIENLSEHTIQLLERHWDIVDLTFPGRAVDGEGVIGKQPILEPGQMHQYISGCNLKSGLGNMSGFYTMERLVDGRRFTVKIPQFDMVVPFRLN